MATSNFGIEEEYYSDGSDSSPWVDLYDEQCNADQRMEKLVRMIAASSSLQTLHLSYVALSQPKLAHLLRSMAECCPTLSSVSLVASDFNLDTCESASGIFVVDTTNLSELRLSNTFSDSAGMSRM